MADPKTTSVNRIARPWEELFFAELAKRGNVRMAAEVAGVDRATVYKYRNADPTFADRWSAAVLDAADKLQEEAWRRAVDGVKRTVGIGGGETTVVTDYSDKLLQVLLEAHHPDFKRQQRIELTGKDGGAIQYRDVSELSDEELARIAQGDD